MIDEIASATSDAARSALLGDRVDLETLARAFNCTTRTIYALTERFRLPFVKIAGRRFFSATDVREALDRASRRDSPPRTPGRPRKGVA